MFFFRRQGRVTAAGPNVSQLLRRQRSRVLLDTLYDKHKWNIQSTSLGNVFVSLAAKHEMRRCFCSLERFESEERGT